jgi:NAD(P)-dependent dehydrogenase (short-subunit alcohol dehydrogenase family)
MPAVRARVTDQVARGEISTGVIVVTGGGAGIGRAMCQRFARNNPAAIIVSDRDAAGAKTAVLSNAGGLFLDMKMWEIAFMDAINHDDLPFDGGSKKGQWHATAMLKCFMPKGQAMITPSAEALS